MTEAQGGASEATGTTGEPGYDQVREAFDKLSLDQKFFALAELGWKTAEQSVGTIVESSARVGEELFGSFFRTSSPEGSATGSAESAAPGDPAEGETTN